MGCWFGVVGEGEAIQLLNSTVYYLYGLFGFAHFPTGDTTPYPFATGAPKVVVLNLVLFSVAIIGLTRLLAKTVRLTIFLMVFDILTHFPHAYVSAPLT